jgi:hypothetical protein
VLIIETLGGANCSVRQQRREGGDAQMRVVHGHVAQRHHVLRLGRRSMCRELNTRGGALVNGGNKAIGIMNAYNNAGS